MNEPDDWYDLLDRLAERQRQHSSDEAWAEFLRRLWRMARLFVDRDQIDDLVQLVALKIISGDTLVRMRAARSPEGYAFIMVRNASVDLERRLSRERLHTQIGTLVIPDPAPTQEQVMQQDLQQTELQAALEELSDSERVLVVLRFWENLSIAEIAKRLEVPYSTVAMRMFRLLGRLRSRLGLDG
jgi:RNA polymerase sigma factor (sigma-70 family)